MADYGNNYDDTPTVRRPKKTTLPRQQMRQYFTAATDHSEAMKEASTSALEVLPALKPEDNTGDKPEQGAEEKQFVQGVSEDDNPFVTSS